MPVDHVPCTGFPHLVVPGRYVCISTFAPTPAITAIDSVDYINVTVGDFVLVETRPINAPERFIYGLNERTNQRGYFPARCIGTHISLPKSNPCIQNFHQRSFSSERSDQQNSPFIYQRHSSSTNLDVLRPPPALPPRFKRRNLNPTVLSTGSLSNGAQMQNLVANVGTPAGLPTRPHRFHNVSVSYPRLCVLCNDYVVTTRLTSRQCINCKALFHLTCEKFSYLLGKDTCEVSSVYDSSEVMRTDLLSTTDSAIALTEQPLANWNRMQVAQWLSVVGLSRFVTLFLRRDLDGHFLVQLTPDSHVLQRVADPFARQVLKRAILVLMGSQPNPGEDLTVFEAYESLQSDSSLSPVDHRSNHDLHITSFVREVACVLCKLPLLGLSQQGYQCKLCGMIFHRLCKYFTFLQLCPGTLSDLTDESTWDGEIREEIGYTNLPRRLIPYKSEFFGVILEQQLLDDNLGVPLFLSTCTQQIEQLAMENLTATMNNPAAQPIDMISVYQQSATMSTVKELHQTFAHHLPLSGSEQSSTRPLDVVRLAQLLKVFLKDLPTPVIPEQNYDRFCALANLSDTVERHSSAQSFLLSLPEVYRETLVHILRHLKVIWKHQCKLKTLSVASACSQSNTIPMSSGATNMTSDLNKPTIWLMVFRQILVRPPWHLITDLATSIDIHMRSLEAIFQSVDSTTPSISGNYPMEKKSNSQPDLTVSCLTPSSVWVSQSPNFQSTIRNEPTDYDLLSGMYELGSSSIASAPTLDTPPNPKSVFENKMDLQKHVWYWGDITQSEVRELMADLEDGYFLVRDASERSSGAFTLAVRSHGENKLLRIYHRGCYFGMTDPPAPVFRLVSKLIEYCQLHPPQLNETYGLRLLWPVSCRHKRFTNRPDSEPITLKLPSGNLLDNSLSSTNKYTEKDPEVDTGVFACFLPKPKLIVELRKNAIELNRCEQQISDLLRQSNEAKELQEESANLIKGYQRLQGWLQIQSTRLNDYSSPKERSKLNEQFEHLKEEFRFIEAQIKQNKKNYSDQRTQARYILENQVQTMALSKKLRRHAQELRRALKDQGVADDLVLTGQEAHPSTSEVSPTNISSSPNAFPTNSQFYSSNSTFVEEDALQRRVSLFDDIQNRDCWFLTNVTRDQAEDLLSNKPPGTFLIRPSTNERKFALDVRLNSSVQHCLIHHCNGKYGFVEKACTFDSLESLVLYYHTNNLKQHNPLLNITLTYPVHSSCIL